MSYQHPHPELVKAIERATVSDLQALAEHVRLSPATDDLAHYTAEWFESLVRDRVVGGTHTLESLHRAFGHGGTTFRIERPDDPAFPGGFRWMIVTHEDRDGESWFRIQQVGAAAVRKVSGDVRAVDIQMR